jgi:hypothetical protein
MHANRYIKGRSVAWNCAVQSIYIYIRYFVATFVNDYMEVTVGTRISVYLCPYLDVSEVKAIMYKHVCIKKTALSDFFYKAFCRNFFFVLDILKYGTNGCRR